mgnify:CR=1 FL=1
MARYADDYVKIRAASQRYGSKVHALGASAPPRARSSPHEGRIIPKRSRRSHGWRTWGQPFAMHRRELTALSTAARTRVHIRDASPRADSAFYSADPRPYITSTCCTSGILCAEYRIQEFNLRARAERERRPRVAPRCARLPGPHGSRFCAWHSGERYGTCVMGFLFLPSTAGGRAHRMARCSPRWQRFLDGTCSIFAGTVT